MSGDVIAALSNLAADQDGMVTSAQAAAVGISRSQLAHLAKRAVLERLTHGVYAFFPQGYDHRRDLRAAWMALDPTRTTSQRLRTLPDGAVVSHTSAAGLHQLGELLDDVHELTLGLRKQTRRPGVRLHRAQLSAEEVTVVDGLPVTTIARTVADLLTDGHDMDHVARIAATALRDGRLRTVDLERALHPLARRYGLPDGQALTSHLLDSIDLNSQVLARELMASGVGQALIAAGRASTPSTPSTPSAGGVPEAHRAIDPAAQEHLLHVLDGLDAAVRVRLHLALKLSTTLTATPATQAAA